MIRKVNNIICNIKATDMPNFENMPKDEHFAERFREYKIRVLSDRLNEL
jgi:hypothetical protein